MKKTFWVAPFMLLASFTLTACGEDDNNEQVSKPNSGQNSGSNSGSTSGGTTSKATYERVSVEQIIYIQDSKSGSRSYTNKFKWTYPDGTVKLTNSRSKGEAIIGTAKKNTDAICHGVALSKNYRYKVTDYNLKITTYYYFN